LKLSNSKHLRSYASTVKDKCGNMQYYTHSPNSYTIVFRNPVTTNKQLVFKAEGQFSELRLTTLNPIDSPADELLPYASDIVNDLGMVFKQLYDGSLLEDSISTDKLNGYTQAIYLVDEALAEMDDKDLIKEILEIANFFHILLPITDAQNWLDV
jgi:hypothetical protein